MALLVKADGTEEGVTPDGEDGHLTYDQVRALIGGGYVQHLAIDPEVANGCAHAYMDEEGKLKQFSLNKKATELSTYTMPGDTLCGDVLFCHDAEDMR